MFQIRVRIDPAAAIRAGKTQFGVVPVSVTDDDVGALAADAREELIRMVVDGEIAGDGPADGLLDTAEFAQIAAVLQRRVAAKARTVVDAQAAEEAARIAAARTTEEEAVRKREQGAKEVIRQKALRSWVEAHGDDSQQDRLKEGFLPESEILEAVTNEVFEDLDDYTVYDPIRLDQACDCLCARAVRFTQEAPPELDKTQFLELRRIREDAPQSALVEAVLHKGACPACTCVPIARLGARVTIQWNGWELVREFSLG